MTPEFTIQGRLVDLAQDKIYPASVTVNRGKISAIKPLHENSELPFIMPGFVDAHVHIESSMLPPSEFSRLAVVHGTVATVSDPHEIANVLGIEGVEYMLKNAARSALKVNFGCPSCVPATDFETAGARLNARETEVLLSRPDIRYLSEMMNFPGVLNGMAEVMEKIEIAKKLKKPIDGHAPGLTGEAARRYINAGISTDHECVSEAEARHKLNCGMKIMIREGSAARNFDALIGLLKEYPGKIMFCSDDKHPDDLIEGHINLLVKRAVAAGYDVFDVLRAASQTAIEHYDLDVGLLRIGDSADFIVLKDMNNFTPSQVFIAGRKVAENGTSLLDSVQDLTPNRFKLRQISSGELVCPAHGARIRVIEALDRQLLTGELHLDAKISGDIIYSDPKHDILKIVVINRYVEAPPAIAFIKNFGLKQGALASSVAHDSHNIVAVGTNDEDLAGAVNSVLSNQGGIAFVSGDNGALLRLPIAGLMSADDGYHVAKEYQALDRLVKDSGSRLSAPFMTLSFMALLVIPKLKLSDKGLFDGERFEFVPLFV